MLLATAVLRRGGVHRLAQALAIMRAITFVIGALMLFDFGEERVPGVAAGGARSRTADAPLRFRAHEAAQVRRRPPEVRTHRLVGVTGHVRGDGLVFVDGGEPARADGRRLTPRPGRAGRRRGRRSGGPSPHRRICTAPLRPLTAEDGAAGDGLIVVAAVALIVLMFLFAAIRSRRYRRGVIFRLGRLLPEPKGRVSSCSSP